jgi:predicted ester cyclase
MSQTLLTPTTEAHPDSKDLARPVVAFVEAVNRGDLDDAVDQLAPDALHHGKVSNYRPDGVRVLFGMLRTVFPDLRLHIAESRTEGQRVVSRIVATATHTGSFLGKPPTGRPIVWESIDIAEVEPSPAGEGRIARRFWDLWGDPTIWREIGFTPALMC